MHDEPTFGSQVRQGPPPRASRRARRWPRLLVFAFLAVLMLVASGEPPGRASSIRTRPSPTHSIRSSRPSPTPSTRWSRRTDVDPVVETVTDTVDPIVETRHRYRRPDRGDRHRHGRPRHRDRDRHDRPGRGSRHPADERDPRDGRCRPPRTAPMAPVAGRDRSGSSVGGRYRRRRGDDGMTSVGRRGQLGGDLTWSRTPRRSFPLPASRLDPADTATGGASAGLPSLPLGGARGRLVGDVAVPVGRPHDVRSRVQASVPLLDRPSGGADARHHPRSVGRTSRLILPGRHLDRSRVRP